jgi:hypothetical protein
MIMTWAERVAHLNTAYPKFPPTIYAKGWVYGMWYTGKAFRKNEIHGQYPPTFLKRVLALFPDVPERRVLHACAGAVRHGIRLDLSPTFQPSVLANVEEIPFLAGSFDLVFYDPPYDQANADIYAVAARPPRWTYVLREMIRILPIGGVIGVLHWYYPSYSRRLMGLKLVGLIGVIPGFCCPLRTFSLFEKVDQVSTLPDVDQTEPAIALPWTARTAKAQRRRAGPPLLIPPNHLIEWP